MQALLFGTLIVKNEPLLALLVVPTPANEQISVFQLLQRSGYVCKRS